MAHNVCVCDVAGIGGQMKEERLICPTTPNCPTKPNVDRELNYKFTHHPAMAHTYCWR